MEEMAVRRREDKGLQVEKAHECARTCGRTGSKEASTSTRTQTRWSSGKASEKRPLMRSGSACAARWRVRCWRSIKVEGTNQSAYKGRGEPLRWQVNVKEKRYRPRKWKEDCWARIFSWFRGYGFSAKQVAADGDCNDEKNGATGANQRQACWSQSLVDQWVAGGGLRKSVGSVRSGRVRYRSRMDGCRMKRSRMRGRGWRKGTRSFLTGWSQVPRKDWVSVTEARSQRPGGMVCRCSMIWQRMPNPGGHVRAKGRSGWNTGNVILTRSLWRICRGGWRSWRRVRSSQAVSLRRATRSHKAITCVGCDGSHLRVPMNLSKERWEEVVEILVKVKKFGRPQQAYTTIFSWYRRTSRVSVLLLFYQRGSNGESGHVLRRWQEKSTALADGRNSAAYGWQDALGVWGLITDNAKWGDVSR